MGPKVIAYYSPRGGKVERHEMWRIDYDEAKKGPDSALWSLTEPKAGTPVDDKTPKPIDVTQQLPSNPPPVLER